MKRMMWIVLRGMAVTVVTAMVASACAAPRNAPGPMADGAPRLPPVPPREGPIAIDVVYPGEGQLVGMVDSTFVFGSVGTGAASLTINGAPVTVVPNGAFLAYLPVPADGLYAVAATAAGQTERLERRVSRPRGPAGGAAGSSAPVPSGGGYQVTLPDSTVVPAGWRGIVSTTRADGTAIGTATSGPGTPYHWFFPNGTELFVTGSRQGELRVRLTGDLSVWVDSTHVVRAPLAGTVGTGFAPEGLEPVTAEARGFVGTVAATPYSGYVDVRLGTTRRLPFRVDGGERGLVVTVYGAETRTNNLLYGATDPLIHRMEWEQPTDEIYRLHIELEDPLWGFQTFFDERDGLVVRVRRPPVIDPVAPLRGLYIGVDAGHPPGGAIGPTRLTEAEATLGVTRYLARMLEEAGARVLLTRPDSAPVDLGERPLRATRENVDLLVSVHFDAFGDGVNPFENHGTHVFYNQAQSLDLARTVQRELLGELGLRDLGVSRRDLALVRPTWMPSILTESAFMMIPQNEASLRDPRVLERIAAAHLRGIEAFLRGRATEH